MKELWHNWHFFLWESLSEELSDFQVTKKFICEMGCITQDMNRKVEMSHPGHLMITTIAA